MGNIVNKVELIGNIGEEPEVKFLDNGNAVATFSLATNEFYYDKDGKKQTHAEWHSIKVWGKKAELVEKLCHKGTRILIDGKLRKEEWKDKDGNPKSRIIILADEFMLMGAKQGEGE